MDRSLLQSKKAQTKSRPSQIVNKSLSMLMDIDTRIFDKLSDAEKGKLSSQLHKLTDAVSLIEEEVVRDDGEDVKTQEKSLKNEDDKHSEKKIALATVHREFPYVFCANSELVVSNLSFSLIFEACKYIPSQKDQATCLIYIVDENNEVLCPIQEVIVSVGTQAKVNFALNSSASSKKECFIVIKNKEDMSNHAQSMTRLKINVSFAVDFDF